MILLLVFLSILFLLYLLYNSDKKIVNKRIIFSPYLNDSFFIYDKEDKSISDIQYSLNKRDNLYYIKDNKLYKKNNIISELVSI